MKLENLIKRYATSPIGKRILSGTIWSLTGVALGKFIVLISGILCARILGKIEYGEFGMIRSTVNVFVALGISGIGLTATKYIASYKEKNKELIPSIYRLTNSFGNFMAISTTVLIFFLAPIIASKTLESPYLTNDIRCGAILLFFTVLNGVQNGILSGFENFKAIALNTFWGALVESILMLFGAYFWGVSGAIIGFGCGFIAIYILNKISITKTLNLHKIELADSKIIKKDFKLLYKFSLPATLSSLMVGPVFWIVRTILVRDAGYGEVAIYEAADQWKIIILFIPAAVSNIVLPILSSLVDDKKDKYWKVLYFNIILNASITLILTIIVCLCGNWIMGLYGKGFTDVHTLIILTSSTIFTSIATVIGLSIASRGKMWTGFIFNALWGLYLIGFSLLFIRHGDGASGLALAVLLSYVIHALAQFVYLKYISTKQCPSKI